MKRLFVKETERPPGLRLFPVQALYSKQTNGLRSSLISCPATLPQCAATVTPLLSFQAASADCVRAIATIAGKSFLFCFFKLEMRSIIRCTTLKKGLRGPCSMCA